jgi:hypothetical protein
MSANAFAAAYLTSSGYDCMPKKDFDSATSVRVAIASGEPIAPRALQIKDDKNIEVCVRKMK